MSLTYSDRQSIGHDPFLYRGIFWWDAVSSLWVATSAANPLPVAPMGGGATDGLNVSVALAAGGEAQLLAADATRYKFRMVNEGPGIARILPRTPSQAAATADATSFPIGELSEHVEEDAAPYAWRVYAQDEAIVVRLLTYIRV